MKKIIIFLYMFILLFFEAFSSEIVNDLMDFNKNSDMNCYLFKSKQNIYKSISNEKKWNMNIEIDSISISKLKFIPMLSIGFHNMENYKIDDTIYNHVILDSCRVYTYICLDKRNLVKGYANFMYSCDGFVNLKKSSFLNFFRERRLYKYVEKEKPDLILSCNAIQISEFEFCFMYIKDGKIYYFSIKTGSIELNEYVNLLLKENKGFQCLKNWEYNFVPDIYMENIWPVKQRKYCNTPKNELNLCK